VSFLLRVKGLDQTNTATDLHIIDPHRSISHIHFLAST